MQMWSDRPKHPDPGLQYPFAQGQKKKVSDKRATERENEQERGDRKKEWGGGEGLSSTGQKLMTTLASTRTDVFEARL